MQGQIIAFLSAGESYGLPGLPVERIETHCSTVFLVDDLAYKLKRAIAFSALDYTSLGKREAACRREVELNRRTAPDLYLGVRAVRTDRAGRLTFEGDGPSVEWVVVMRRFAQADLFDRLADAGRLTPDLARALADEIARFHAAAEVCQTYGGARGLREAVEHNHRDLETVASVLGKDAIDRLHTASLRKLADFAPLLDRRRDEGKVRLCHGDLRLANICLYHGRPTLFDAIEFADELACVDVLYDLAFLVMDLAQRDHEDLAKLVLARYIDKTKDRDGLPAFPLMLSIRAATRSYSVAASSLRKSDPLECKRLAAAATSLIARAEAALNQQSFV